MNGTFAAAAAAQAGTDLGSLTWSAFFVGNLLPDTIGNVVGGALFVGCTCWFVHLKRAPER